MANEKFTKEFRAARTGSKQRVYSAGETCPPDLVEEARKAGALGVQTFAKAEEPKK